MQNTTIIELVNIAHALSVATGRKPTAISGEYLGGGPRLQQIENGISDVGANKADEYIARMSRDWPADKQIPLALLNWRHRQEAFAHPEYSHDAYYGKVS
ncbi:hypothetical protein [Lentilitoribacter sp. EG35]|uniref:hypothetical protein n=1 Tax=Lentilitoribacter sp. EG35 TaxID=3234192 RepID=UPI00345FF986